MSNLLPSLPIFYLGSSGLVDIYHDKYLLHSDNICICIYSEVSLTYFSHGAVLLPDDQVVLAVKQA